MALPVTGEPRMVQKEVQMYGLEILMGPLEATN